MTYIPHSLEATTYLDSDKMVQHYTCNPPKLVVLKKYGIIPIGDRYGLKDSRELLLIPFKVYAQYGLILSPKNKHIFSEDAQVLSEILLRKIDSDNK